MKKNKMIFAPVLALLLGMGMCFASCSITFGTLGTLSFGVNSGNGNGSGTDTGTDIGGSGSNTPTPTTPDSPTSTANESTASSGGDQTQPDVTETDTSLVVMSYNLDQASGAKTLQNELVISNIIDVQPDLLGVQEETHDWENFLKGEMAVEGYEHVCTFRGNPPYDEASGIFYKVDRFTLKDSGAFWLSETPSVSSVATEWGAIYPRICTWVLLTDKRSGEDIAYFNTHFAYETETARTKSAELITSKIKELGVPAFFSGDLNFASERESEKATYETLTAALDDSRVLAPDTMSGCTFHNYGQKSGETITDSTDTIAYVPIDYIFSTKGDFVPTKFTILQESGPNYSSDHYSINARFEYATK